MSESDSHLAHARSLERQELLRSEGRHLWVRLGVALTALVITLSLKVAVMALAVSSTALLIAFPIVARWLGRGASRAGLRAITRAAVGFYVAIGALWVVLLAPNADDLALAIAAPTLAAAATIGLGAALGATALLLAADVLAAYLRAAVYGHPYETAAIALQFVGLVGIGVISGLWTDALRSARRAGRRQRRAQALLTGLAESLATLAATALANARLHARVELQRRRLRLLHEVRAIVGSSLELETILERALEQLEDVFGMTRTFVLLPDDDARSLRIRALRGQVREDVADLVIAVDQGLTGAAFRDRRIVNVADVTKDDRYVLTAPDVRSEIALPLVTGDTPVGVLLVSSPRVAAFGPDDEQMLALFAGELSAAIANARTYEAQREAAVRDDRTGLYNHRYFREVLDHELANAERHRTPLSLLLIDLDGLKGINDRHGHHAGDAVIERVAKLMTCERRRTDVAARIGGEEFALILPETAQAKALAIAERLRADAALETVVLSGASVTFTMCVGVATFPDSASDAPSLRRAADMAMYEAKRAGRDRVIGAPRP